MSNQHQKEFEIDATNIQKLVLATHQIAPAACCNYTCNSLR